MHSHHSHSGQYCTHATGDLEDCIKEAIRQKFELFCLTEHIPRYREVDLYPGETPTLTGLMQMFRDYHAHARHLQAKYKNDIEILVGLETEFIRDIDLDILECLIAKYPIDMIVGSVHHVNTIPIDFDKAMWLKALKTCRDEEDFYGRYFDHQYSIVERLQPQVIGHFDVVLLFAPPETNLLQWQSVKDKIERNIQKVISYGGLFELNSSAFRKGWNTSYPKPNIVELIKAHGGHFCLSDDSHGPHQVGLNYHRLREYVRDIKLSSLSHIKAKDGPDDRGVYTVTTVQDDPTLERFMSWTPRTVEPA